MPQYNPLESYSVKEFESSEKTRSAAADDGCTSSADLQALDQHGSSLAWLLHQSVLETSDETPSALHIQRQFTLQAINNGVRVEKWKSSQAVYVTASGS